MRRPIRVAGVVVNKSQILLIHREKEGRKYYVFPGGGVEDEEDNEEALLREIKEETSTEIKINKLLYRHNYETSNQCYYLCDYVSGTPELSEDSIESVKNKKGNDFYVPLWVNIDKLSNLLLYPLEIRDWLLKDLKNNFQEALREATLKVSELRQS